MIAVWDAHLFALVGAGGLNDPAFLRRAAIFHGIEGRVISGTASSVNADERAASFPRVVMTPGREVDGNRADRPTNGNDVQASTATPDQISRARSACPRVAVFE